MQIQLYQSNQFYLSPFTAYLSTLLENKPGLCYRVVLYCIEDSSLYIRITLHLVLVAVHHIWIKTSLASKKTLHHIIIKDHLAFQ